MKIVDTHPGDLIRWIKPKDDPNDPLGGVLIVWRATNQQQLPHLIAHTNVMLVLAATSSDTWVIVDQVIGALDTDDGREFELVSRLNTRPK